MAGRGARQRRPVPAPTLPRLPMHDRMPRTRGIATRLAVVRHHCERAAITGVSAHLRLHAHALNKPPGVPRLLVSRNALMLFHPNCSTRLASTTSARPSDAASLSRPSDTTVGCLSQNLEERALRRAGGLSWTPVSPASAMTASGHTTQSGLPGSKNPYCAHMSKDGLEP